MCMPRNLHAREVKAEDEIKLYALLLRVPLSPVRLRILILNTFAFACICIYHAYISACMR